MERLEGSLRQELGRFGAQGGMAEIVAAWPTAVGETIARNAWPARISRDGTMLVTVSSSSWAFELAQLEPTILAQLGEALGAPAPPRLKFAPGPLPEPEPDELARPPKPPEPTAEQRAEAERIAAPIEDESLRKIVAKAAAASLAGAPARRQF